MVENGLDCCKVKRVSPITHSQSTKSTKRPRYAEKQNNFLFHIQSSTPPPSPAAHSIHPEKAGQTFGPAGLLGTSAPTAAAAAIHTSLMALKALLHLKSLIPLTASPTKLPSPATAILSRAGMPGKKVIRV